MAERKVQNKYISPYFNHEKLVKLRRQKEKQDNVRMMLPFSIKCDTCGNYLHVATKLNMRKETCTENYLGIEIYRFYMKCNTCYREITMKTDPRNHDYVLEKGAVRLYESWKDGRAAEELLRELRQNEEEGNLMKSLENRTYDARRDLEISEALDEIRLASRKHARYALETVVAALDRREFLAGEGEVEAFKEKTREAAKRVKPDSLAAEVPLPSIFPTTEEVPSSSRALESDPGLPQVMASPPRRSSPTNLVGYSDSD